MVWSGDGADACGAGAAWPAPCQDRAAGPQAGKPGFGGPLQARALLKRQCGAVVRQDGSLMRCLGSRMTTRFAAVAHGPLVQHPSQYGLRACDAVACRREGWQCLSE